MVNPCNSLAELKEKMNAANLDDKLVVIYFWCGCSKDAKRKDEIEKLATEEKKDVVFLEVNTDCEEAVKHCKKEALHYLMQCFNINAPFIFIKDGAKIDEVRGAKVGELEATIKKHKY